VHIPQYLAGRALMRSRGPHVDETHVIGAVALQGALADPRTPSLVWIATTIGGERRAAHWAASPPRWISHRATLPVLERLERSVLRRSRRVMVHSPYTADLVVRAGVKASRVEVVPIPIDTDQYAPADGDEGREGVLFVGRALDPRKGCERLMALLDVSEATHFAGVDIVSTGSAPPWAVRSDVRWRGRVEDLPSAYRRAQVLALPSRQEGFGIVAFEALASGTPVVAYRCGGPDQLLRESGGGIVVENADEFRRAIERLLGDCDLREELGVAGRSWVDANLSAKQFLANPDIFRV
jgi:glycosyltransferase involved in cell wall biosynthesis